MAGEATGVRRGPTKAEPDASRAWTSVAAAGGTTSKNGSDEWEYTPMSEWDQGLSRSELGTV